jgi:23S rRNA (uracil1939-C5)-methyltransferase
MKNIELTIETLTNGGRGLGRHNGKAVFVPFSAPGDRLFCKVVREKAQYAIAETVTILEPSLLRRKPPCPYYGDCGGCQWQHMSYPVQTEWKAQVFREMLLRKDLIAEDRIKPIVAAPAEFGYRNRVQLKCRLTKQGLLMGFFRPGSHTIVDVDRCLLVAPDIQAVVDRLRLLLPDAPHLESLSQVDLACDDQGEVQVVMHVELRARRRFREWLVEVACKEGFNAALNVGRKASLEIVHGRGVLHYQVGQPELKLQVSAGGFAQINSPQNRVLVDELVREAALQGGERVLDLFCGTGNFSLPLARSAAALVGVEGYAPAIADARRNADANGIRNCTFYAEDAAGAVSRHGLKDHFDVVALDPPRSGSYQVVKELSVTQTDRIFYVSCDPGSLVRDLTQLSEAGYRVVSSQPFDLFPQTWHIESLTVLERGLD